MKPETICKAFEESASVKTDILSSGCWEVLAEMGEQIAGAIKKGGKLMICGNGGSAADAQHLAAELLIRLRPSCNRNGLPALALAQDTSTITACGNDFGFDALFERMVQSLGRSDDVLLAITTSGNSENIVRGIEAAKKSGIPVFGFLGAGGGRVFGLCDKAFLVPSDTTARIQESHITAGHALMEYIEDRLLDDGYLQTA